MDERTKADVDELIARAAKDLVKSEYAIALTGAGISTESGVPDFRGPSGVWTKNPEAERRAYQGYQNFINDPKAWWLERLASRASGPLGNLEEVNPNAGHRALVSLESMGILRCVITQNVDGLHEKAGTRNLLEFHGNFRKLRCIRCESRFGRGEFDLNALAREGRLPPTCPRCGGIVKTDSVAFGEPIPQYVMRRSLIEAERCDLILICGTSAVVYPFASLPRVARQSAMNSSHPLTIVEVNAEPTALTYDGISDYLIRGKTGEVLPKVAELAVGLTV